MACFQRMVPRAGLLLSLGVVLFACKHEAAQGADASLVEPDRDAAAIMNAANDGEVELGQLAMTQATDADVKAFAKRMVTDHTATKQRQSALFTQLAITPSDNATSQELHRDAQNILEKLRHQTGRAFDKSYIDSQVTLHMRVLGLLDNTLIPKAQRSEWRADLQRTRGDIFAHLQTAQQLQSKLAAAGPADGGSQPDGGRVPSDAGAP